MQRRDELAYVSDLLHTIDMLMGFWRTQIGSLPARLGGRDITERRRFEGICNELMDELVAEAKKQSLAGRRENERWRQQHKDCKETSRYDADDDDT